MRHITSFLLVLLLLSSVLVKAEPANVRFCADEAQWPPFSYSNKNGVMKGFTVDLLKRAFAKSSTNILINQRPWNRCLVTTKSGQYYQVAIDASSSPERKKIYLLTRDYYTLTPYFFYSLRLFPDGINIKQGQELAQFGTVCGLLGYNYSNFALGPTQVHTGSLNFYSLAKMVHSGRCAIFIGRYEIVAGLALIGRDLLEDPELAYAPIPDALPEPFHMLISRNYPEAEELKQLLDEAIESMSRSGELNQLRLDQLLPR